MEYLTYRSFYTTDEATEFAEMLNAAGIPSRIEKLKQFLDHNIIGETQDQLIELKIPASDFNKANALIDESIRKNLSSIGDDHYLHSFTNNELIDIIKNPSQWSRQDVVIAKHLLDEKHVTITGKPVEISGKKEAYTPEQAQPMWLFIGYTLTLFGLMGFFSGLSLVIARKVLPDGTRVAMYNKISRGHGVVMMSISAIFILLAFFIDTFLILNLFGVFTFLV